MDFVGKSVYRHAARPEKKRSALENQGSRVTRTCYGTLGTARCTDLKPAGSATFCPVCLRSRLLPPVLVLLRCYTVCHGVY